MPSDVVPIRQSGDIIEQVITKGEIAMSEPAHKALEERDRLYRQYVAATRTRRQEIYGRHPLGPQLQAFAAILLRFGGDDAARMLAFVQVMARDWLATAPPEIRAEALSLVAERIRQIRERKGQASFDDPLPGEDPDIFQLCRRELA